MEIELGTVEVDDDLLTDLANAAVDGLMESNRIEDMLDDRYVSEEEVQSMIDSSSSGLDEDALRTLMDSMPSARSSRCSTGIAATKLIVKVLEDAETIEMLKEKLGIDLLVRPVVTDADEPEGWGIGRIGPFESASDATFYRELLSLPVVGDPGRRGTFDARPARLTFCDVYGVSTGLALPTFQSPPSPRCTEDLGYSSERIVWLRLPGTSGRLFGVHVAGMPGPVYAGPFADWDAANRWVSVHGLRMTGAQYTMDWPSGWVDDVEEGGVRYVVGRMTPQAVFGPFERLADAELLQAAIGSRFEVRRLIFVPGEGERCLVWSERHPEIDGLKVMADSPRSFPLSDVESPTGHSLHGTTCDYSMANALIRT